MGWIGVRDTFDARRTVARRAGDIVALMGTLQAYFKTKCALWYVVVIVVIAMIRF